MYIKLENDFGVDREKNPQAPTNKELTLNWLQTLMAYGFKQGLTSDKRRIMSGVVAKLATAEKTKADYLEVNAVQYMFLQGACNTAVCSPQEVIAITTVENAINGALTELPAAGTTAPINQTSTPPASAGATAPTAPAK